MNSFKEIGLPASLVGALEAQNITTPTPIQAQTVPLALEGKDVLGSAQTGTGKTLAFTLPLIVQMMNNPQATAMIMTPTRELAQQVAETIKKLLLAAKSTLRTALLIGGEPMFKQFQQLRAHPRIIVGTPGRILDHLERKSLDTKQTSFLVLDETDRMLDMGFGIQIDAILKFVPKQRQTLMFSATIPNMIAKMANNYMVNPERVSVGSTSTPIDTIKQEILKISESQKYGALVQQLESREGSIIIFVKTKINADDIAERLCDDHHDAVAIHGDLRQHTRQRVINDFRRGKYRILVATDVAARGLDVPHIQHVINYDLPQCPEDYIHRIGRTGRAGAEGVALSFITPQDGRKWGAIDRMLNPQQRGGESRGGGGESRAPRPDSRGGRGPGGYQGRAGGRDRDSAPASRRADGGKKPFRSSSSPHGRSERSENRFEGRSERSTSGPRKPRQGFSHSH